MQNYEEQFIPKTEILQPGSFCQSAMKAIKKHWPFFLKIGIAILMMIVLIKSISIREIGLALRQAHLVPIVLTCLLLLANIYVQYRKWKFMVQLAKPTVTEREILYSLLIGFTLGFVTPGRLGDIGRAFFVKDMPWQRTLGLAVIDKIYSAGVVYVFGIPGLLVILQRLLHFYLYLPLVLIGIIVITLLMYILLNPQMLRSLFYLLNVILPRREKIKVFLSSLDNFFQKQSYILLGWCLLFSFIYLSQFYLLTLAFDYINPLYAYAAATSTFFIKTLLPISFGDLGIREGAAVVFFKTIGVKSAVALNASLLLFVINVLIPSLSGLVIVLKNKLLLTFYNSCNGRK